jgi:hypothetical protein
MLIGATDLGLERDRVDHAGVRPLVATSLALPDGVVRENIRGRRAPDEGGARPEGGAGQGATPARGCRVRGSLAG